MKVDKQLERLNRWKIINTKEMDECKKVMGPSQRPLTPLLEPHLETVIKNIHKVLDVKIPQTNIQTAKNDLLAGLIFARETAMARSDGSSVVKFIATETSIDVQVNDTSIRNINQSYPLTLSDDVTITSIDSISGEQQLQFTHLGETIEQTILLEDEDLSLTISVSGVGYAY